VISPANAAPSIVTTYSLLDLKCVQDDQTALELYRIVESVQAQSPGPKQDAVSLMYIIFSYHDANG
jgi:hypothetical protein